MSTTSSPIDRPLLSAWFWPAMFSLMAFAANSVLCRLALKDGAVDAITFTALRLGSGALCLWWLVRLRNPCSGAAGSWRGGLALFCYAFLFSIAYLDLSAGVGALLLFGAVQLTMFSVAAVRGERISLRALSGMLMAFSGLVVLLLPGSHAPTLTSALLMVAAGMAWGLYTLLGQGSPRPLADTAGNFVRSVPFLALCTPLIALGAELRFSTAGVFFAVCSGMLASAAGYAVWYSVVRRISAQQAATLQLSVPVIASLGGVLVIGEALSLRAIGACAIVLGGVAIAVTAPRLQAPTQA
ncbi:MULTISPECIES: DMT family transporter [Pseudomonas]|uniref:DMT family transporter n=1 Tax=Pseudomonas TaxID=286 RepID=UPI00048E6486|nr:MULTISPECIES: DMT family transporter [Pseudomonas]PYB88319.1 EamA/RhaT family transporter [Pseudomonas fulva]PYC17038.1 EamA/RhaT family transporter [Pseudomonas fulva]